MKALKLMSMLCATAALSIGVCSCGDNDSSSGKPEPTDYALLLPGHWSNVSCDDDTSETLSFNAKGSGSIAYEYSSYPGDDEYEIIARGTCALNGNTLTASYTQVSVYTSTGSKSHGGFTDDTAATVVYTIESCDGRKLTIRSGSGPVMNFEKYADIK